MGTTFLAPPFLKATFGRGGVTSAADELAEPLPEGAPAPASIEE